MAAILLTILKITGIVLASVLALVLLVLVLILFVPIRYRIRADRSDPSQGFRASAAVTYLLHVVSGKFIYEDEFTRYVKVFGIKIWPKADKPVDDNALETVPEEKPEEISEDKPAVDYQAEIPSEDEYSIDWNDLDESDAKPVEAFEFVSTSEDTDEEEDIFDRIDSILDSIRRKYEEYSDKIDAIRKKIRYWDKMVHDERNKRAVSLIYDQTVRLLKKIAPRRIKGFVHFGFEDPATTGRILAYLAMIYPVMPKKFRVEPSFTDTDIYGTADIKGRLALASVAACLLKLYFDKDCRRLWRLYKKHSK